MFGIDVISKVDVDSFFAKYPCNGYNMMSLAILNGSYKCIKKFAYWQVNWNEKQLNDNTYLHLAAISGHVNIFLFLLSKQVNFHSKNQNNLTAFQLASKHQNFHLMQYLSKEFKFKNI